MSANTPPPRTPICVASPSLDALQSSQPTVFLRDSRSSSPTPLSPHGPYSASYLPMSPGPCFRFPTTPPPDTPFLRAMTPYSTSPSMSNRGLPERETGASPPTAFSHEPLMRASEPSIPAHESLAPVPVPSQTAVVKWATHVCRTPRPGSRCIPISISIVSNGLIISEHVLA